MPYGDKDLCQIWVNIGSGDCIGLLCYIVKLGKCAHSQSMIRKETYTNIRFNFTQHWVRGSAGSIKYQEGWQ